MTDQTFDIAEVLEKSLAGHRAGDFEAARSGYLEVLRHAPNHPAALNLLGTLDAQQGNFEDAERLIRRAISFAPKEGSYFTNLASVLQSQERFQEAIKVYRVALKLEPGQPEVLNNFGALLLRAGQAEEAEHCFRKVLESRPDAPEAFNNLGRTLNNQRKYDEAVEAFKDAIRLDPNFAAAYNNLGHVHRAMGRKTLAAASFQEAIRLDEDFAEAYQNLGTVYLAQNMPEEAIECLEEAVRRDPGRAASFVDLGVALHGLGRVEEALAAYRKAVAVDDQNPYTFLNLGLLLYERRNLKAAETALRQALVLKPDLVDAAAELAGIMDELGRLEELQSIIEKGLSIAPHHARLNLEAARLERRQGEIPAAIERLSKFDLKTIDPRLAQQLRYELGRLHDRAGEPDLAWLHSREANNLAAAGWRAYKLDPKRLPDRLQALQAFCSDTDFSRLPAPSEDSEAPPIFLTGFPASGSDFVAEVLRRHPQLQVLDEAPTLSAVAQALSKAPEGFPAAIGSLDADGISAQRDAYWQIVNRLLERNSAAQFIDHHPMSAVHAVLAWRLFPSAKFIYVQRHPADLCVANFMQNYAMNDTNAHFLALESTVTAIEQSYRTWQAAATALPISVFTMRFESLAENPKAELRRALEFLGLKQDDAMERFVEQAQAGSQTTRASFRQLADPLDPHMCGRWRQYRREIGSAADKLLRLADQMGYDFD